MFWEATVIFSLNFISNSLKTLKTILISKKIIKPAYIVVFLEAIILALGFKMIAQSEGVAFLLAFALGKAAGVWFGNFLENLMALGVLEVTVFAKKEKAKRIADALRDMGYSVTTHKGYGYAGLERFAINITIRRRELPLLKDILKKYGYVEATMVIRELESFSGKICVTNKFNNNNTSKNQNKSKIA